MPKDKDRALNPATAQLKADKARALKKGKAAITAQRNERLASRNPVRLERQIGDLRALAAESAGGLGARDKRQLEELEKQLGLVRKAREKVGGGRALGVGGGVRGGGGGGSLLGKRARGEDAVGRGKVGSGSGDESGSETDESVRRIPMPRDTPPPIPFRHRNAQGRGSRRGGGAGHIDNGAARGNANMEPLGPGRERVAHALPGKPEMAAVVPKTTYEAKPVVRDLRKEAVRAFMPAVVAKKVMAVKGGGGRLLEEEEVEKLEQEGYMGVRREGGGDNEGAVGVGGLVVDAAPKVEERVGVSGSDVERKRLEEEEERFGREVRMEEVSDEDL
ncbi:MAG: hypothetical protein Q9182_000073 [Xanthomendoza sp. 2 TL-2023]